MFPLGRVRKRDQKRRIFFLSVCLPKKTVDISRRHHWLLREMTSYKQAQKFHIDDAPLPRSGLGF